MEKKCPLLNRSCIKQNCRWYFHLDGQDPNTGAILSVDRCVVEILPKLMMEISQQTRQAGASFDKAATEQKATASALATLVAMAAKVHVLEDK